MEKQDIIKSYFNAKEIITVNAAKIRNLEINVANGVCVREDFDKFFTIAPKGADFKYFISK
jgi:hypothetical protein